MLFLLLPVVSQCFTVICVILAPPPTFRKIPYYVWGGGRGRSPGAALSQLPLVPVDRFKKPSTGNGVVFIVTFKHIVIISFHHFSNQVRHRRWTLDPYITTLAVISVPSSSLSSSSAIWCLPPAIQPGNRRFLPQGTLMIRILSGTLVKNMAMFFFFHG